MFHNMTVLFAAIILSRTIWHFNRSYLLKKTITFYKMITNITLKKNMRHGPYTLVEKAHLLT